MRRSRLLLWGLILPVVGWTVPSASAQTIGRRTVLVELYTSQGCDMCPEAEAILGALGEANPRLAPLAMHVDYFNKPWKDPFSSALHSQRQAAYNACYKGEKHPEYGLYFTPLLMIDGLQPVNGRDRKTAEEAIRRAMARAPGVSLAVQADLRDDDRTVDLRINVAARAKGVSGRDLLVCTALRDDRVSTAVMSGENANKTLLARYPARLTTHAFVTLQGTTPATVRMDVARDPLWNTERLSLVTFVQDRETGAVHQSRVTPWPRQGAGAAKAKTQTDEATTPGTSRPSAPGEPKEPEEDDGANGRRDE
jgi:hypothetical protein